MTFTLSQIKTEIQKNCGRNYTDFNDRIEGWLNRRIKDKVLTPYNFWFMEHFETIQTADGTRAYNLPTNYKDDMPDAIVYRNSSNATKEIDPINEAEARKRYTDDDEGEPEVIVIKESTFEVWPKPNAVYNIDWNCYVFLADLSDSNTNNYLSNNYPNLYIYGGTVDAWHFLEEPELSAEWEGKFTELLNQLVTYNIERKTGKIRLTPRADVKTHAKAERAYY